MNRRGARSRSSSDAIERIFQTGWSRSTAQIASRTASAIASGSPAVRAAMLWKIPPFCALAT